jgi:hypothetical protein
MEKQHGARRKHSNRKVLRSYIDFMMLSSANKIGATAGFEQVLDYSGMFYEISEEIPDLRATW